MRKFVFLLLMLLFIYCCYRIKSMKIYYFLEKKNIDISNVIFLNAWKKSNSLIHLEFLDALNNTNLMLLSKSYSVARDVQTKDILKEYGFINTDVLSSFHEFDVLDKIVNHCNNYKNNDDYILYIHFKGSYHDNRENSELRKMLIFYVIRNYDKCIIKLKRGADVCGSRYSLLPYRHYSGNMWWSKCKYIKTLKHPKYTIHGKRYSVGFNGYNGDRYSAEKWILSNSQSIPSDLMSDDIEFSYNYGNEGLYKTWIQKPQNIPYSPNFKILYSTVKFNKEMNFYPHTYYSLYFNLLYDYEVYFDYNKTSLFDLGWCKGLLLSKSIHSKDYDGDSIHAVKNIIEFCKIVKGLRISKINSTIQRYKTTDKDIIFLSNSKCNNDMYYNNKINNEFDIICSENNDINNDYQTIFDICRNKSFNKNIYYSHNDNDILQLRLKCEKKKEFCGKWFIYPFRGNDVEWKASCQFIRNAGKPKYYSYKGDELEKNYDYYGFNNFSYLHWPLTNPFQSGNCDELDKSNSNIEMLYSVLINTVFDIKSDILNKENIHKCYWWCNCFSFNKKEKIEEGLNYFCNICNI